MRDTCFATAPSSSVPVTSATKLAPSSRKSTATASKLLSSSTGENFQRNLRIVDEIKAVASEAGATPAQIALAWLLAQGDDIAPIPGTKRVARVEENTTADSLELSAEQLARLNDLTPAEGERHDAGNMAVIDG